MFISKSISKVRIHTLRRPQNLKNLPIIFETNWYRRRRFFHKFLWPSLNILRNRSKISNMYFIKLARIYYLALKIHFVFDEKTYEEFELFSGSSSHSCCLVSSSCIESIQFILVSNLVLFCKPFIYQFISTTDFFPLLTKDFHDFSFFHSFKLIGTS